MKIKRKIIFLLILLLISGRGDYCFGFANELELKAELRRKLQTLRERLTEEVKGIYLLNKELQEENTLLRLYLKEIQAKQTSLLEEISFLKQQLSAKPPEKVIYKPDPLKEKELKELKDRLASLEEETKKEKDKLQQQLRAKEELISSLNLSLKKAQEIHNQLIKERDSLKQQLSAKPPEKVIYKPDPLKEKELKELKDRLASLEEETKKEKDKLQQQLRAKEELISSLKEKITNYEKVKAEKEKKIMKASKLPESLLSQKRATLESIKQLNLFKIINEIDEWMKDNLW